MLEGFPVYWWLDIQALYHPFPYKWGLLIQFNKLDGFYAIGIQEAASWFLLQNVLTVSLHFGVCIYSLFFCWCCFSHCIVLLKKSLARYSADCYLHLFLVQPIQSDVCLLRFSWNPKGKRKHCMLLSWSYMFKVNLGLHLRPWLFELQRPPT